MTFILIVYFVPLMYNNCTNRRLQDVPANKDISGLQKWIFQNRFSEPLLTKMEWTKCSEGLHETVAILLLEWVCEVGWSSTLNQDNLLSRSREQICSYFKAAPLFVMIKVSETPISQCWLERWTSFSKRLFFFPVGGWLPAKFRFWNKDTCMAFYW